jgi:hypothetical protein
LDTASRAKTKFATIKARNAATIPETLRALGADADAVMRRAGIEPGFFANPNNDLAFAALGHLISECVNATGCEAFGLRVRAQMGATATGLTGLVSLHAPTVREALQVIAAGLKTSDTGGVVVLDQRGDLATFGYVVTLHHL